MDEDRDVKAKVTIYYNNDNDFDKYHISIKIYQPRNKK